jgi:hypothetical protein
LVTTLRSALAGFRASRLGPAQGLDPGQTLDEHSDSALLFRIVANVIAQGAPTCCRAACFTGALSFYILLSRVEHGDGLSLDRKQAKCRESNDKRYPAHCILLGFFPWISPSIGDDTILWRSSFNCKNKYAINRISAMLLFIETY